MDWFKKIFQVFKEDSAQAEDSFEYRRELQKDKKRHNDSPKVLNAKISYQYPKGTFRFPVMPDKHAEQKPRSHVRKANNPPVLPENTKIVSPVPKQQAQKQHENRQINKTNPKTSEPEPKPKVKKVIKRHGPFRPTEIPSPIYGYERPKRTQVVEHELTGFLNEEIKKKSPDCLLENEASVQCAHELNSNTSGEIAASLVVKEEIIQENILSDDSQVAERLEETADRNESTERPNGRSHLPFNVIMLKQDREKLEERKLRRAKSANLEENKEETKEEIFSKKTGHELEVQSEPALNLEFTKATEPVNKLEEEPSEFINGPETLEPIQEKADLNYVFPEERLLLPPVIQEENEEWLQSQEILLNQTLNDFNVGAKVVNVTQGPSVTRFEVQPDPGVKVNKITNLQDDIKLSLAAKDIRIEAPIPGKHTIGIEVPNQSSRPVLISEILLSPHFRNQSSPLTAALGLDISGKPVVTDLRKMPHGLIAGATGSGKSVCINTILTSILYKANPNDVKLMLIDPKMVELAPYNHIPHLVSPVITDVKAATAALKWAVEEMERRYELFAHTGVRDISRFNELAEEAKRYSDKLPYMLIVIDELADLMMIAPADVEEAICRIAQKARACGMHLIIATQRPSVDVITGLIKANIPTRIAFSVSSQIDSRTIIDMSGAEKLLGRGDMLFLGNGTSKPVRLQGTFISDNEIDKVVDHVRSQGDPEYLFEQTELLKKAQVNEEEDELFYEACEFVVEHGGASTSSLQRRFKIGYNRAARLIDMMEHNGFISESRGSKPRDVLITEEELDSLNGSSRIN